MHDYQEQYKQKSCYEKACFIREVFEEILKEDSFLCTIKGKEQKYNIWLKINDYEKALIEEAENRNSSTHPIRAAMALATLNKKGKENFSENLKAFLASNNSKPYPKLKAAGFIVGSLLFLGGSIPLV